MSKLIKYPASLAEQSRVAVERFKEADAAHEAALERWEVVKADPRLQGVEITRRAFWAMAFWEGEAYACLARVTALQPFVDATRGKQS